MIFFSFDEKCDWTVNNYFSCLVFKKSYLIISREILVLLTKLKNCEVICHDRWANNSEKECGKHEGKGLENKIFEMSIYKIGFIACLSYINLNEFFLDFII